MAIELNHTIVPAHDKVASAKFLARILGLSFDERAVEYFAPVRINDTLTLDFDDDVDHFDIHHYAFHVSDLEFDDILKRVQETGIPFGSDPQNLTNKGLNSWNGGRGVYFCDPNGHILELLTRASATESK